VGRELQAGEGQGGEVGLELGGEEEGAAVLLAVEPDVDEQPDQLEGLPAWTENYDVREGMRWEMRWRRAK
jgi:hypothetical protein